MAALGPAPVPVPGTVAVCDDLSVIGVPFTVVDHVDGIVVRDEAGATALSPEARATVGPTLAATLAEIHRVDPATMGLGDPARAVGYLPRQLDRWNRQWQASAVGPDDDLTAVHAWLVDHLPVGRRVALVHGDFRLDNCIVGPDGRVRAVLDWELAALGDPLADVAMFLISWAEPADTVRALPTSPTAAGGFAPRSRIVDRYAESSGWALDDLDYYVVFALWRLACIFEGVRARHHDGAMGEAGRDDAARFATHARGLARAAQAATTAPDLWVGQEVIRGERRCLDER